ncbi:hypothetical protein HF324_31065 [Chitinophaga oryzae]|uniref:Uncharacterized protein n=1 Tax=Chitinophaga oryzae TaxID=2725414 RepID=A0AAE6ZMI6_9BACT|nr:hypothetical protein [Chitinophaga oryzae]QJB35504.1 hypothetical protein HF329_31045 [Chitinophaga oryzae]QJB42047.1 hypothetical protein HF324_31065 [Chitinophaga oryzae]
MATLYVDYQQLVMQAYEQKKGNNMLPHGLMHLTPANLKDECVKKCTMDVNRRDEKIIRDFCGDLNESKSCQVILQRCETDKFRPLVNYLKGKSENTDAKNIELLAWLLDFPDRPWVMGKVISGMDQPAETPIIPEIPTIPEIPDSQNSPESSSIPVRMNTFKEGENTGKPTAIAPAGKITRKSTKSLVAAIMLSLVAGTGGMWWWMQPPATGDCMYWHEDRYEPVACNQRIPNAVIVPRDTLRLKYFRKITRPDTITYRAIGKVWYSKIKGEIEFFTLPGEHPVVFGYQLRPLTIYMIKTRILQKN